MNTFPPVGKARPGEKFEFSNGCLVVLMEGTQVEWNSLKEHDFEHPLSFIRHLLGKKDKAGRWTQSCISFLKMYCQVRSDA